MQTSHVEGFPRPEGSLVLANAIQRRRPRGAETARAGSPPRGWSLAPRTPFLETVLLLSPGSVLLTLIFISNSSHKQG